MLNIQYIFLNSRWKIKLKKFLQGKKKKCIKYKILWSSRYSNHGHLACKLVFLLPTLFGGGRDADFLHHPVPDFFLTGSECQANHPTFLLLSPSRSSTRQIIGSGTNCGDHRSRDSNHGLQTHTLVYKSVCYHYTTAAALPSLH